MSIPPAKILVVGAAGRFGGLVTTELARRGATVRALLRNPASEAAARANGASEIVIGDLRRPDRLPAALDGIDAVFHLGPAFVADEAELGVALVDVAKLSGVRKIVFSSVIHPTNGDLANHRSKLPVEQAIFTSGLDYTLLYPATVFQNLAAAWPAILATGVFVEAFAANAALARVDYRDVAEVAAEALTGDRLSGGAFELCADDALNRHQIAALIGDVLGRRIEAAELGFREWVEMARPPYDARQLAQLERVFQSYSRYGSRGNSLTLTAILKRPPRTLRDYVAHLARTDAASAA
ncbi:NmrA family NAD(P)-binding protein [Bradyrhizobium sp. 2TAF24]|uniref:NmrA family NAD(P)-binding protein n=1 Tax=Bradyrhizobium sp. 2TAF24 TaxID=3233011 RepID=UPI003F90F322